MWIIFDANTFEPLRHFYSLKSCKAEFKIMLAKYGSDNVAYSRYATWVPKWEVMELLRGEHA